MSRANGKARKSNDNYPTPYPLARAIVDRLDLRFGMRIIEPSAGMGTFIRALRARLGSGMLDSGIETDRPRADITAIDVVDHSAACMAAGASRFIMGDCVKLAEAGAKSDDRGTVDLILGNPPFTYAEDHIRALVPLLAPSGVLAFLLRLNFLGSDGRWVNRQAPEVQAFWREFPLFDYHVIAPRPSFGLNKKGKKGTDGTEYALFLWKKDTQGANLIKNMSEPILGDWSDPEADAFLQAAYTATNAVPPPGLDEAISTVAQSAVAQTAIIHAIAATVNNITPGAALDVEV